MRQKTQQHEKPEAERTFFGGSAGMFDPLTVDSCHKTVNDRGGCKPTHTVSRVQLTSLCSLANSRKRRGATKFLYGRSDILDAMSYT